MDMDGKAATEAFADPSETQSGSLRSVANSDSRQVTDLPFLRIDNNSDISFRAPKVYKARALSGVSRVSRDSGYFSDSTTGRTGHSVSSSLNRDNRDLTDPVESAVAKVQSNRAQEYPRAFQCHLCPKRFRRAYNLRSHVRCFHTKETPFVCTDCGEAFAREHGHWCASEGHSQWGDFVCKGKLRSQPSLQWGCGRRFAQADSLGRHLRSQDGRNCIKPLYDEEARESIVGQHEVDEADIDAKVKAFILPAALLMQYPALGNLDCFQSVEIDPKMFDPPFEIDHTIIDPWLSSRESGSNSTLSTDFSYSSLSTLLTDFSDPPEFNVTPLTGVVSLAELNSPSLMPVCADAREADSSLQQVLPDSLDELCQCETKDTSAASVSLEDPNISAGKDKMTKKEAKLSMIKRAIANLEDLSKLREDPKNDDEKITDSTTTSCASCHDSREAGVVPSSSEYSANFVPESIKAPVKSGAFLAKLDCVLNPSSTAQHTDSQFEKYCMLLPFAGQQTDAASMRKEERNDGEKDRLSDKEAWPLSRAESPNSSDSDNGYESTSEKSIFNKCQNGLISRLMDEICSSSFYQVCRPRQRGGRSSASISSDNTQTSNKTMDLHNKEPAAGRRKRGQNDGEDPEDEEDGKRKRQRSNESVSFDGSLAGVRYFACPFHKFDRTTYSNCNENPQLALKFRSCGAPGWPTIGKMKYVFSIRICQMLIN